MSNFSVSNWDIDKSSQNLNKSVFGEDVHSTDHEAKKTRRGRKKKGVAELAKKDVLEKQTKDEPSGVHQTVLTKKKKRRLRKKKKLEQSGSAGNDTDGHPPLNGNADRHIPKSVHKKANVSGEKSDGVGKLEKAIEKLDKILTIKKKRRRARKSKDSRDSISHSPVQTSEPQNTSNLSSVTTNGKKRRRQRKKEKIAMNRQAEVSESLHVKPTTHSPTEDEKALTKKLKMKLKRKQKRAAKKEAHKEDLKTPVVDTDEANDKNINEVNLSSKRRRKMRKLAKSAGKKLQEGELESKESQGTSNPSFDTSTSELQNTDAVNGGTSDNNQEEKKKKKRRKRRSKSSDTIDGNACSTSQQYAVDTGGVSPVKRMYKSSIDSGITDVECKKKFSIAKPLKEADIEDKTTLTDLKKKRRLALEKYAADECNSKKLKNAPLSLRERMTEQLKSARFRWLNEQLYTSNSWDAMKYFKEDPDAFEAYHSGYRRQVAQWPVNPLDVVIETVSSLPKEAVIADFGCGDANLAESLQDYKVHSLDIIASKPGVIACDMAHTPLLMESVDVAVFCLSLMGTNLNDFILEANRVLKPGGLLLIAEVESRFEDIDNFTSVMVQFGFQLKKKNLSHKMFIFFDFKKTRSVSKTGKLPVFSLEPCLYKKR